MDIRMLGLGPLGKKLKGNGNNLRIGEKKKYIQLNYLKLREKTHKQRKINRKFHFPSGVTEDILVYMPYTQYFISTENFLRTLEQTFCKETMSQGFPGGSVVKNAPANAGDVRSIPDVG